MKIASRLNVSAFRLTFMGTRGDIDIHSRRHRRHSALLVRHGKARIMIDCGADWLGQLQRISPTAIVLTHAHSDHAAGLAAGAPCPVYATQTTWNLIHRFPIRDRRKLPLTRSLTIQGIRFKAVRVEHSVLAPAVGLRAAVAGSSFFYIPDVARIPRVRSTLRGIDVYIGDGATVRRAIVRRRNNTLIGHAPVIAQLDWCKRAAVQHAIFTHCGSQIVRAKPKEVNATFRQLGRECGIDARTACDGDELILVSGHQSRWKRRND